MLAPPPCPPAPVLPFTPPHSPLPLSSPSPLPPRAPEQWQAERLTNRVDVWSWACLMLQLMTGSPPWLNLNMYQVGDRPCLSPKESGQERR
jgi:serine/threonine protein kinase